MSEVKQLGRSGVAAEVAPGSGTGAGQRRRPALAVGLPRSATDLSEALTTPWACLLLGEMVEGDRGLCLMAFKALSSWAVSCRVSEGSGTCGFDGLAAGAQDFPDC